MAPQPNRSTRILNVFACFVGSSIGRADTLTGTLDQGSTLGSGNYGTVTVTDVTGGVDVTVLLTSGNELISGNGNGHADAFTFLTNLAATLGAASSFYPGPGAYPGSPLTPTGLAWTTDGNGTGNALDMDGAGKFGGGYNFSGNGVNPPGGIELDFSLGGVTTANFISNGTAFFAADISTGCTVTTTPSCNGSTGIVYADNVTLTATPLPAALPLFAGVLGALGLLGWRRKRKARCVAV